MKQILFLSESEVKRIFREEDWEFFTNPTLPANEIPAEFYSQMKTWAEERKALYAVEFPDEIFDGSLSGFSERSIRPLKEFSGPSYSGLPSHRFPPFLWGEFFYLPYGSANVTAVSRIGELQEKIENERTRSAKNVPAFSPYRLVFKIEDDRSLEEIAKLSLPEPLIERIYETSEGIFLSTKRLGALQSAFAAHFFSAIIKEIEFKLYKVIIDFSEVPESFPAWMSRSARIVAALDRETSPRYGTYAEPFFELKVYTCFSPSFLVLVLSSCLLDALENREIHKTDDQKNSPSLFSKNESWRDFTEHRFAARVSRQIGEEESFFQNLLQKEYENALNSFRDRSVIRKRETEEFIVPELLERLKLFRDSEEFISLRESDREDWNRYRDETVSLLLDTWKRNKETTTKKIEENSSASAWKSLLEIWKS